MTPDPLTQIAELEELNRKRTPGKLEATFKQDVEDYPPAVIERAGYKSTIGEHWDSEICTADYQDFAYLEFFAALANACDPDGFDLLGKVRRGEEAEQELSRLKAELERVRIDSEYPNWIHKPQPKGSDV